MEPSSTLAVPAYDAEMELDAHDAETANKERVAKEAVNANIEFVAHEAVAEVLPLPPLPDPIPYLAAQTPILSALIDPEESK